MPAPPNASRISSRNAASSGPSSRPQCRIPPTVSSFIRPSAPVFSSISPPIRRRNARRPSSVPGSGSSVASNAARQAANGLRAGQMCSVEICPCRTFFSCTESSDASRSGNAASISRRPAPFTRSPESSSSGRSDAETDMTASQTTDAPYRPRVIRSAPKSDSRRSTKYRLVRQAD